jgi:hypothetical protein
MKRRSLVRIPLPLLCGHVKKKKKKKKASTESSFASIQTGLNLRVSSKILVQRPSRRLCLFTFVVFNFSERPDGVIFRLDGYRNITIRITNKIRVWEPINACFIDPRT